MKAILPAILIALACAAAHAAGPKVLTTDQLAAAPAQYYSKPVCIKGTVLAADDLMAGSTAYSILSVRTSSASVTAAVKGSAAYSAGQQLLACGVFRENLALGARNYAPALYITTAAAATRTTPAKPAVKRVRRK